MAFRKQNKGLDISEASKKFSYSHMKAQKSSGLTFAKSAKYSRSTTRAKQGEAIKKTKRVSKQAIIVIFIAAAALLLATLVGFIVYKQTVKNSIRPNLDANSLQSVLVSPSSDESPFWAAFVLTNTQVGESKRGSASNFALCHVDAENEELIFLWVPSNARIYLEGSGYLRMSDLFEQQHESGIVQALSSLANVDIAHYVEFTQNGLSEYALKVANLNLTDGSTSKNQTVSALLSKIVGSSSEDLESQVQTFDKYFATDMDLENLLALFTKLQGMDVPQNCCYATMPYSKVTDNSIDYAVAKNSSWKTMVERAANGLEPVASKKETQNNKILRASNKVTVWNGAGVTGIAADCVNQIKKLGWEIESSGNASQFVYEETLVVYKKESNKKAAKLLVSDLGQGRAVASAYRYSFDGDLLVVVGKDYMPY